MSRQGRLIPWANTAIRMMRRARLFFGEGQRSPTPHRWRDECRERRDQELDLPAGRGSVDRIVRLYFVLRNRKISKTTHAKVKATNGTVIRSA